MSRRMALGMRAYTPEQFCTNFEAHLVREVCGKLVQRVSEHPQVDRLLEQYQCAEVALLRAVLCKYVDGRVKDAEHQAERYSSLLLELNCESRCCESDGFRMTSLAVPMVDLFLQGVFHVLDQLRWRHMFALRCSIGTTGQVGHLHRLSTQVRPLSKLARASPLGTQHFSLKRPGSTKRRCRSPLDCLKRNAALGSASKRQVTDRSRNMRESMPVSHGSWSDDLHVLHRAKNGTVPGGGATRLDSLLFGENHVISDSLLETPLAAVRSRHREEASLARHPCHSSDWDRVYETLVAGTSE